MLRDFTKERFDIIIQAGQSNSEGCGYGGAVSPYQPKDAVWYLESEDPQGRKTFDDLILTPAREAVLDNDVRSNYALAFADCWLDAGLSRDGRKLLILRSSVGATGFSDGRWMPDGDLYLRLVEMIRTALALNPENRLRAFLWHQGENEVGRSNYEEYKARLGVMLNSVRTMFNCPNLPFVCGDFVHQWKMLNFAACQPIVAGLRDFCAQTPHCAFVETDELPSDEEAGSRHENIHFSRESLYRLGRKYFAAYREIAD